MLTLKLAWGLAFSRDPRQRWRQVSVVTAAFVATLTLLVAASVAQSTWISDTHRIARTPVLATSGQKPAFYWDLRFASRHDQQFPITWLEPGTGSPPPPGLRSWPEPGSIVLSPGLVSEGVTASDFGLAASHVGTGVDGAIGDEGVKAASEAFAYATPATGRSIRDRAEGMSAWGSTQGVESFDGFRPLPTFNEAGVTLLWAMVAPALFLLGGAARSTSTLRRERSRSLYRLGLRTSTLRIILAVEAMMLAAAGALPSAALWTLLSPYVDRLPLTNTTLLPGTLVLPISVTLAVLTVAIAVVGIGSAIMRIASARVATVSRPPAAWSVIPLCFAIAMMIGAAALDVRSPSRAPVLFGGMLLALAGIPLGLPYLTARLGSVLARRTRPATWLAGRRLETRSIGLSRPAAAIAALIFISGSAVALYDRMEQSRAPVPHAGSLAGYDLGWSDPRAGDLAAVTRAFPGDIVIPVVNDRLLLPNCDAVRAAVAITGVAPRGCGTRPGAVPPGLASQVRRQIGSPVAIEPTTGLVTRRAYVLQREQGDEMAAMRSLAGVLPAPNVEPFYSNSRSSGTTRHWIIAGWSVACLLLVLALLRDICDRVFLSLREDTAIIKIGLPEKDLAAVQRWSLVPPLGLAIPIGVTGAVAFALVGNQLGITIANLVRISAVGLGTGVLASVGMFCVYHLHRRITRAEGGIG